MNRQAIARRSFDQRHVAQSAQRHVERARNRRRRKREHIDALLQLFQTLFMGDAKTLFFIDHNQSEIAKAYVLGKHSMRADHDINLA